MKNILVVTLICYLSTMVLASGTSKIDQNIFARYREVNVTQPCKASIRAYLINKQIQHYSDRGSSMRSQQLQDHVRSTDANDEVSVIYDTQEHKYRVEVVLDSSILNKYFYGYGIVSWLTHQELDQIR